MTTIAIDWVNKTLYTDSRATVTRLVSTGLLTTNTEEKCHDNFIKIWRTDNLYHFFTGTGDVKCIERFLSSKKHKHLKDSYVWEIDAVKGIVISHNRKGGRNLSDEFNYTSNGSGSYCFKTAMNFTDDPEEAMHKIADLYTGGKIHKYKIDWSYLYEDIH